MYIVHIRPINTFDTRPRLAASAAPMGIPVRFISIDLFDLFKVDLCD